MNELKSPFKHLDKKEFAELFPVTVNSELAKKYGVTESNIRLWATRLNLKKKNRAFTSAEENYILNNYQEKKISEISAALGRSKWSVINKYRKLTGLRD